MKRSVLRFTIVLLLITGKITPALAEEEFASFIFENDVFTDNSDDGYTNGMGYAWGRAGFDEFDDSNTPGWIQWLSGDLYISTMTRQTQGDHLPGFPDDYESNRL